MNQAEFTSATRGGDPPLTIEVDTSRLGEGYLVPVQEGRGRSTILKYKVERPIKIIVLPLDASESESSDERSKDGESEPPSTS